MKTKLYYLMLILLAILMEGCVRTDNVSKIKNVGVSPYGDYIDSFEINGHEYLKTGHGFTHSGTCKKCKQERDSIIKYVINELK